jgi:uncharacterized membrane protein YeaQ/YmgE (transglycosylase-associated protein family)
LAVLIVLLIVVLVLLLSGALVGLAFELLWLVLTGLVVGALGRLVLPGRQEIGLLATALVGIGASLLGASSRICSTPAGSSGFSWPSRSRPSGSRSSPPRSAVTARRSRRHAGVRPTPPGF